MKTITKKLMQLMNCPLITSYQKAIVLPIETKCPFEYRVPDDEIKEAQAQPKENPDSQLINEQVDITQSVSQNVPEVPDMPDEDTLPISGLSEISDDNLIKSPIRLLQVKEVGKNKIPAKQIGKLKAFADGSHLPGASSFKILLNTNYSIRTGEGDMLEPAVKNRLSVLPFTKTMDNTNPFVYSFEDVHFEKEKQGIIIKALMAFSDVLNNGNKFSSYFEPNDCIEYEDVQPFISDGELSNFDSANTNYMMSMDSKFDQLLDKKFILTPNINFDMTATRIMESVNASIPNELKDVPSTGKKLRNHYGDALMSKRNSEGDTCYNLDIVPNQ